MTPYLLPWLRVELLIRTILATRWDAATWPVVRRQLAKALRIRAAMTRGAEWN